MTQPHIHPTAVVDPNANLGSNVRIGPFCVVGAHVTLGDHVDLKSHVVVDGYTSIGEGTVVFPFAVLGTAPQDKKFRGEESRLVIGKHNNIREHVTMQPGTADDRMETTIGDHGLFMVGVHVAHDCVIGDHVIMANNATLGGHVKVGDGAVLGGLSAVLQRVRIGEGAMIGGMSGVENDVIPFGLVIGERARLAGLNLIGLERKGVERSEIFALQSAFKTMFYGAGTFAERLELLADTPSPLVQKVLEFADARNNRPLCQPRSDS